MVLAGVTALVLLIASASQGADPRQAYSKLVELHIDDGGAAGFKPFDGVYGTAGTPDLSKPSDDDPGDFSDPDGVKAFVQITGTQVAATAWDATSGQLTARANMTALESSFNGVKDFIKMGSIDSYANCVNGTAITAYARNDGSLTYVAGHQVTSSRAEIPVTGADLGLSGVATGVLSVSVDQIEQVVNQPTEASAEAWVELKIYAVLKDADGKVVYEGPMVDLKLGHVYVSCMPKVLPSPSTSSPSVSPTASPTESPTQSLTPSPPVSPTTSPTESPTASPTESPTTSPTVSPTESPTASPTVSPTESPTESPTASPTTPTASPTSSSASPTGPPHPTGPTTPPHPTGTTTQPPGPLPVTGSGLMTVVIGSLAALFAGVVLLVVARRQREKNS